MKHTKKVLKESKEPDKEHAHIPEMCQEHAKEDLMKEFVKAIMTMSAYMANKLDKEE